MVGPSLTDEAYEAGLSKVQVAVIGLVAGSGALVASYADASLALVAASGLGGAVVGFAIWRYLRWSYQRATTDREETEYEKRRRFD